MDFRVASTWIQILPLGIPWWLSGKESACQCRTQGFDAQSRKIPHAAEQLSPRTTTTEPALESVSLNYGAQVLQLLKPQGPKAHAPQQEKAPQ